MEIANEPYDDSDTDEFYDFDGNLGVEMTAEHSEDDLMRSNDPDDPDDNANITDAEYLGMSELGTIILTICIREDVFDQTTLRNIAATSPYFRRLAEANLCRIAAQLREVYPRMVRWLRHKLMNPVPFVESRVVRNRFDAHWWNPGFGIELLRRDGDLLVDLPGWRAAAIGRIVLWTTTPRQLLAVFSLNGLPLCSHDINSYEKICDDRYFTTIEIFADNPLVLDDNLWHRSQVHLSLSAGWSVIQTTAGSRVTFQPDIDLCADILVSVIVEYRRHTVDMRYWRYCEFTPNWTVFRKSLVEPRPPIYLI